MPSHPPLCPGTEYLFFPAEEDQDSWAVWTTVKLGWLTDDGSQNREVANDDPPTQGGQDDASTAP